VDKAKSSFSRRTLTRFNLSFLDEFPGRFTPLFSIPDGPAHEVASSEDGGGMATEFFLAIPIWRQGPAWIIDLKGRDIEDPSLLCMSLSMLTFDQCFVKHQ